MASGTVAPSPSSTRPSMRTRSPETSDVNVELVNASFQAYSPDGVMPYLKNGPTVCDGVIPLSISLPCTLVVLHRRGVLAAQHDVEAVAQRPFGLGVLQIERRDHPRPRLLVRHRIEDRVERKQRVGREIHLRHQSRDEGMAEHREMNMRGTPGVVVIAPGIGAGLDGDEPVVAGGIAHRAACSGEIRIERRRMLVADMDIA